MYCFFLSLEPNTMLRQFSKNLWNPNIESLNYAPVLRNHHNTACYKVTIQILELIGKLTVRIIRLTKRLKSKCSEALIGIKSFMTLQAKRKYGVMLNVVCKLYI